MIGPAAQDAALDGQIMQSLPIGLELLGTRQDSASARCRSLLPSATSLGLLLTLSK
jgi:hypothetical protein